MTSSSTLKFTARRQPAVLVAPAGPTPRELKLLSDIDDQDGMRFHVSVIHLFRRAGHQDGVDPAPVLRDAIAAALVYYYPLAGRLRELEGRKLAVDCTGEGVLFVEADADVCLDQFGSTPLPPFPCLHELLFDVPGSSNLLHAPLFLFQVTRLACGGFIMAVKMNHAMVDGPGLAQFLTAVAELARGASAPTVQPVWKRELLMAPSPGDVDVEPPVRPFQFVHREYDEVSDTNIVPLESMVHPAYFFFGPREMAAIRSHLPPALRRRATTYDLLSGCLWRCRTIAMAPAADEEMRMICIVSVRARKQQQLPVGYYGNSFAYPVAIATAGDLCANPLSYAVELVMKTKREVDLEYLRSVARLMVCRGRPHYTVARSFLLSDLSKAGFRGIDFGWGTPVYAGPNLESVGAIPGAVVCSFVIAARNAKGDDGVTVPISLPRHQMDKFVEEMRRMMRPVVGATPTIKSMI